MSIYDQKFGERVVLSVLAVLAEENPPTTFGGINRALQERGQGLTFLLLLNVLSIVQKSRMIDIQRRFLRRPVITITALGRFTTELGRQAA